MMLLLSALIMKICNNDNNIDHYPMS